MKWPRGKYCGRRIVGARMVIIIDVTQWEWMPIYVRGVGGLHWLCLRTFWQREYE